MLKAVIGTWWGNFIQSENNLAIDFFLFHFLFPRLHSYYSSLPLYLLGRHNTSWVSELLVWRAHQGYTNGVYTLLLSPLKVNNSTLPVTGNVYFDLVILSAVNAVCITNTSVAWKPSNRVIETI